MSVCLSTTAQGIEMENTALVDGINITYDVAGEGDELLLIHSMGSSHELWKNTMKAAAKLFKVYAIDLPGYGSSEIPDAPYGVPYYVDFIKKFLDEVMLDKVYLAGISMGGAIAAMFSSKYPDRVKKLVLVAPAGLTPLNGVTGMPVVGGAAYWLISKNKEMFKKNCEDSFYNKSAMPPGLVEERWQKMQDPSYRSMLFKNTKYLSKVDPAYQASLKNISCPTLIIWGKDDAVMPLSDAEKYLNYIGSSSLSVIDGCGHVPPLEKTDEFNRLLLTFFGEVGIYYES